MGVRDQRATGVAVEIMNRIPVEIDKLIHTKNVSLTRSEEGENAAVLEMDILLFDLTKKASE